MPRLSASPILKITGIAHGNWRKWDSLRYSAAVTRIPHTTPGNWPAIKPGRFAGTICTDSPDGCDAALIGLPDDTGIVLNNGHPGAALGPTAFRAALAGYGSNFDAQENGPLEVKVYDAGDVQPAPGNNASALAKTHDHVTEAVLEIHKLGLIPDRKSVV